MSRDRECDKRDGEDVKRTFSRKARYVPPFYRQRNGSLEEWKGMYKVKKKQKKTGVRSGDWDDPANSANVLTLRAHGTVRPATQRAMACFTKVAL